VDAALPRGFDASAWLLLDVEGSGLTVRRASGLERVLSRVRARSLDQRLVEGESPDRGALLALRARFLLRPATRRVLARSVARVLSDAVAPSQRATGYRAQVARHNILDAADGLAMLMELLNRPGPVSARGIAAVQLLMSDGAGPVYNPHSTQQLSSLVEEAIQAMTTVD
jgi:hypothetical protein